MEITLETNKSITLYETESKLKRKESSISMVSDKKMKDSKMLPAIADDVIFLAEEEEKLNKYK